MTPPNLEYVALVVDDPQQSAAFFETQLQLPRGELTFGTRKIPTIKVGKSALTLFEQDDPFLGSGGAHKGVHHIGVAAEDPLQCAVHSELLTAMQAHTEPGLGSRSQVILPHDKTCGVRTRLTEPLSIAQCLSDSIHSDPEIFASNPPGMVERIDHIGVASTNNESARAVFIDKLSFAYESEQTDSEFETRSEHFTSNNHPTVFHSRPTRLVGSLRVTFISVGDCELEFLQDLTMDVTADSARHNAAGNTRGDRSAMARFINNRGEGLHHLALKTPDIDRTLSRLSGAGIRTIDNIGRPGSRRARIGFVHPVATSGVLLHFVQREEL